MKQNIRIKIMQESTRAKNLKNLAKENDGYSSFKLMEKRKEIDKKIIFLKKLYKEMEK